MVGARRQIHQLIRVAGTIMVRPDYETYQGSRSGASFSNSVSKIALIFKFTNLRILPCPFGPIAANLPPRIACTMIGCMPHTDDSFIPGPDMVSNWAGLHTLILDDRNSRLAFPLGQPNDIVLPS